MLDRQKQLSKYVPRHPAGRQSDFVNVHSTSGATAHADQAVNVSGQIRDRGSASAMPASSAASATSVASPAPSSRAGTSDLQAGLAMVSIEASATAVGQNCRDER
jgi:hypothetical protein